MNANLALQSRAKVEEFRRRHRVGLITLVFTDIVDSTRLKQALGDERAVEVIWQHHALVREVLQQFPEGEEIETAGDSFFIVFAKPSDAITFGLLLQNRLAALPKVNGHAVLDRMGIHLGEVVIERRENSRKPVDLYGIQVDIAARVASLALGNQILMTRLAFDSARPVLKGRDMNIADPPVWLNHGPYLLKGVEEPMEICEVGVARKAVLKPPPDSEKVHRYISPDAEPVLGWRPALGDQVPNTKWVLQKKLGEGAFGEVWLGRHDALKERRVFKFCFRIDRVRTLKREVTLFRLLRERVGRHPNIVGVQEVFFESPPYYIMMDYAEATDLRAWCTEKLGVAQVPVEMRLEIVAQAAEALQAAHDAGIIHRDVKPTNILVSDGAAPGDPLRPAVRVQLTDFGIGQVMSKEYLAQITRAGFTSTVGDQGSSSGGGTHLYMAPEVVAGRNATPQSDIYSLGVVLYQLLVGDLARPLTTDWIKEISDPLLRDDLEKCFAGDPQQRFREAKAMAVRLRMLKRRREADREGRIDRRKRERKEYRRGLLRAWLRSFFKE